MYSDISTRLKSYEPFWENWYLDSYIGRGASSTVYKIKENRFGSTVYAALKVVSTSIDDESGINREAKIKSIEAKRIRAEQEITNMYKLNECPNVVHCHNYAIKDIYDEDGKVIGFDILIHMDYYTCFSKYLTKNNSVLSEEEVIKLAKQIGTALKDAHEINIIHRDIKPENFFIDNKGNYLLGDLGVSKQVSTSSYSTVAGTHPYMAPEVWRINQTKRYTKTADIYSFGIVLYSLLNNNYLPMVTKDKCSVNDVEEAINQRLIGSTFMPPENGSEELKAIVMKACQYDEKQRYQSMDEFLSDINNIGTKEEKEQLEPESVPVNNQLNSFETEVADIDLDDESLFETEVADIDLDDESFFETEVADTDLDDELLYHENQNQIKCAVCRRSLYNNKKACNMETQSGEIIDCQVCNDCYRMVTTLQNSAQSYRIIESINYLEPYLDAEFQNGDTTEGKKFKSYINKLIENKKTTIDNSSYEERAKDLSIEKTSEDEDWTSNKKSVVFRFACILVVIFFLFLIGVSFCVRNIKSDESDTYVDDVYDYEEDNELGALNENKFETETTTTTITTTTTVQTTTIEIVLHEPYFIKYKKDKDFVSMHSEANTNSKILKKIKPNGKKAIKVIVLSKDTGDLWRVKYDGKIGYIHKDNLTIKKQKATTAKPTTTTQKSTTTQQQYISQQQNTTAYQPKATTTAKIAKKATKNESEYYMMVY